MNSERIKTLKGDTTEYYSALRRHKIDTWVNLEGIMLSEIGQAQKGRFCMIPLI